MIRLVRICLLSGAVVLGLLPSISHAQVVKPGIDVLRERDFDVLKGKRVGLITNPTGVTSTLETTIDVLSKAPGVRLVALFGPEHGVRGDVEAGQTVENYVDAATGLPVYSLYGRTRKPTPQMLSGIDVLVYDIQDIGVRSYTYISSMGACMEAAADQGIEFVVLDRPNPLTGDRVEGPVLDLKFRSFIGAYAIPYVYGMTAGELATMINEEGWLNGGRKCVLKVVPVKGWKRWMWWEDTGLQWILPSPHIPHSDTPMFYVMTGLLGELGTANQGVGYTLPFELVGAPWMDSRSLAAALNARDLPGIAFRPLSYKPFYFEDDNVQYNGVQLHVVDRQQLDLTAVQLTILDVLLREYPSRNLFDRAKSDRISSFDRAMGTDEVRKRFQARESVESILEWAAKQASDFSIRRQKYLMYD
ncbi:MAG TPA: DUF1343 domain-containing protein [Syntrophobacteraceae bacterium]|nr:DUF1343 domain-containing protein [Syntrophobacteraceae bacterium]